MGGDLSAGRGWAEEARGRPGRGGGGGAGCYLGTRGRRHRGRWGSGRGRGGTGERERRPGRGRRRGQGRMRWRRGGARRTTWVAGEEEARGRPGQGGGGGTGTAGSSRDRGGYRSSVSLGSCSRYFRDICSSDCLWFNISKKRWPSLPPLPPVQGWKDFYTLRHKDLTCRVSTVIDFVKKCSHNNSLEVGEYLKAVENLAAINLAFEDVKIFFLTARHSVLLNLVGLHYSMFSLGISGDCVNKALQSCGISDRQICVFTLRLGRWLVGYRLPDEHSYRKVTLGCLTTVEEADLRSILSRGAVHEVLRVQITSATLN